jgi:hypothetical protein
MSVEPTVTLNGRDLGRPGHICAFFDSREEEYDVLTPYYQEGLDQGEQIINIVDAHRHSDHCRRLKAHGIAVDDAMAGNKLKVLTSEDTYTAGGRFGADRMYRLLQGALADAARDNRRVRTSGVMDWSAAGTPGTEELMDYESRVNVLVPTYDCTLLCVYDLNQLPGRMVMDILKTHPYVVHGRHVLQNPYYVPPIELLTQSLLGDSQRSATPPA